MCPSRWTLHLLPTSFEPIVLSLSVKATDVSLGPFILVAATHAQLLSDVLISTQNNIITLSTELGTIHFSSCARRHSSSSP